MFKSILLIVTFVTLTLSQDKTVVTIENPKVDSIASVVEKLKFEMLKDKIFTKARIKFINSSFNDQVAFLESLISYKDSAFIVKSMESLKEIKDKEIEQLREIIKSSDDYEVKGMCRLHIKKVQDQILKLQNKINKYTHDEFMKIEHQVVEQLKVE